MIESVRANSGAAPHLFGLEGELVQLRVPTEPRLLEELLETLASLDFPVNPQIIHQPGVVFVEFPAYASHVADVQRHLKDAGFDPGSVQLARCCAT